MNLGFTEGKGVSKCSQVRKHTRCASDGGEVQEQLYGSGWRMVPHVSPCVQARGFSLHFVVFEKQQLVAVKKLARVQGRRTAVVNISSGSTEKCSVYFCPELCMAKVSFACSGLHDMRISHDVIG